MNLEDRIRRDLGRSVPAVPPTEDAWERIRERLAHGPRPARRPSVGRLAAAAVALAVAAVGLTFAILAFSGHRAPAGIPAGPRPNGPIAYVGSGTRSGFGIDDTDLFAVRPDGTGRRDLTPGPGAEHDPIWSPDGSKVIFVRDFYGNPPGGASSRGGPSIKTAIFVMNADGSNPRRVLSCGQQCPADFAWSPDGSKIAFVVDDSRPAEGGQGVEPGSALEVMNADGSRVRRLCDLDRCGQGVSAPAWSPDGSMIAFSQESNIRSLGPFIEPSALWVIRLDGSGLRKLSNTGCHPGHEPVGPCPYFDSGPAWSPDGSVIAFSRIETNLRSSNRAQVDTIRPDGTGLRTLFACADACPQMLAPAWSPDGRTIVASNEQDRHPAVWLIDADGSGDRTVDTCATKPCSAPYEVRWSPDGRELAFVAGGVRPSIFTIGADGAGLRRVVAGVIDDGFAWLPASAPLALPSSPSVAPSGSTGQTTAAIPEAPLLRGRIAFDWGKGGHQIYTIRSDGSGLRAITSGHYEKAEPAWSPDGRRIAFSANPPGTPNTEIFVMDADGSHVHQVTDSATGSVEPTWSPDGSSLAFACSGAGDVGMICTIAPDGSGLRPLSTGTGAGAALYPRWSPDGRSILFVAQPKGSNGESLYLLDVATGSVSRLTDLQGSVEDFAWSPDGSHIVFTWFTDAGDGLYTMDGEGTSVRRVGDVSGVAAPAWSPDGSRIAFVAEPRSGLPGGIYVIAPDGSRLARVLSGPSDFSGLSWGAAP